MSKQPVLEVKNLKQYFTSGYGKKQSSSKSCR